MEHLFQLLSKVLSLWSRLWCIYKSFQEGLSDILLFHLFFLQAIPIAWDGLRGVTATDREGSGPSVSESGQMGTF